jgi:hypothetical protein
MHGTENLKFNNFILSISLLIMFDTLLLRPSLHCNTPLHFTTPHPTTHHYTSLHFTLHPTTLHYTYRYFTSSHLHFTALSFSFTHLHFLSFYFTSHHITRHSTDLISIPYHTGSIYRILGWSFLLTVDRNPCPRELAIVANLFPLHHLM